MALSLTRGTTLPGAARHGRSCLKAIGLRAAKDASSISTYADLASALKHFMHLAVCRIILIGLIMVDQVMVAHLPYGPKDTSSRQPRNSFKAVPCLG